MLQLMALLITPFIVIYMTTENSFMGNVTEKNMLWGIFSMTGVGMQAESIILKYCSVSPSLSESCITAEYYIMKFKRRASYTDLIQTNSRKIVCIVLHRDFGMAMHKAIRVCSQPR